MGWFIRLLLFFAGIVAGWLVPRDQLGYSVMKFVVLLVMVFVISIVVIYYQRIRNNIKQGTQPPDPKHR